MKFEKSIRRECDIPFVRPGIVIKSIFFGIIVRSDGHNRGKFHCIFLFVVLKVRFRVPSNEYKKTYSSQCFFTPPMMNPDGTPNGGVIDSNSPSIFVIK